MERVSLRIEFGFTLIELLVVICILGLLGAIAISQFASYRRQGYEAAVRSDLKNAATAEEAYFSQNHTYKAGPLTTGTPPGYNQSADIDSLQAVVGTNTYLLTATHSNCAAVTWTYSSAAGI